MGNGLIKAPPQALMRAKTANAVGTSILRRAASGGNKILGWLSLFSMADAITEYFTGHSLVERGKEYWDKVVNKTGNDGSTPATEDQVRVAAKTIAQELGLDRAHVDQVVEGAADAHTMVTAHGSAAAALLALEHSAEHKFKKLALGLGLRPSDLAEVIVNLEEWGKTDAIIKSEILTRAGDGDLDRR